MGLPYKDKAGSLKNQGFFRAKGGWVARQSLEQTL
jgi:hypothetical protein